MLRCTSCPCSSPPCCCSSVRAHPPPSPCAFISKIASAVQASPCHPSLCEPMIPTTDCMCMPYHNSSSSLGHSSHHRRSMSRRRELLCDRKDPYAHLTPTRLAITVAKSAVVVAAPMVNEVILDNLDEVQCVAVGRCIVILQGSFFLESRHGGDDRLKDSSRHGCTEKVLQTLHSDSCTIVGLSGGTQGQMNMRRHSKVYFYCLRLLVFLLLLTILLVQKCPKIVVVFCFPSG